jgi:hypothetical protein
MLENCYLVGRTVPRDTRSEALETQSGANSPRNAQFTNLRMRTFIAAPSARKVNSTEDPP